MAKSPQVGGFNSLFNSLSRLSEKYAHYLGSSSQNLVEHKTFSPTTQTQLPGDIQSPKEATTVGRTLSSHGFFWHGLKIGSISFTTQSLFSLSKQTVLGFIHFYTLFSDTSGSLFIDQSLFDGQTTIFQNFRWLGHVQLIFVQEILIF